jgi:DUF4097 and DUF4098 domain-containing protein YvlB
MKLFADLTKITPALVLAFLVAVAAAAGPAGAQTKTADADKITVPLSDPSRPAYVKASLLNGSITVRAYQGKDVVVQADVRPGTEYGEDDDHDPEDESSDKDLARRKGMKKITNNSSSLTVEEDNNEVEIGTGWRSMGNTLDMVIQVPVNASIKLNTMNDGDITVTGVRGDVEVSNLNGNIEVRDVTGSVVADAMNGDIDVVFSGIDTKKSMSFSSMNGEIDVTLPVTAKATLKLKTDQGEIYSDFDMKLDVATEDSRGSSGSSGSGGGSGSKNGKHARYKVSLERVMTGSLNGGGAEMTFKNFNGNIYIRKGK